MDASLLDPTALQTLWFAIIAFFFTGYFVLEGFDFGVQMDVGALGRGSEERRGRILRTIGPVWDGNEVWLITGGAAIFAAFPEWYATMFSGFYLALLLLLLVLIVRVCAFKYRDKQDGRRWRGTWDVIHVIAGVLPPLLWGVAFGNVVAGVGIDGNRWVTTSFLGLLNPFALLAGLVFVLLFWLHGTLYLALKVEGELRRDAHRLARRLAVPTLLAGGALLVWYQLAHAHGAWTWSTVALAAVALLAVLPLTAARREGWSFAATSIAIAAASVTLFGGLFPYVMPSSTDPATSLTVANASSSPHTLTVMSIAFAVLMPVVIAYQAWTYWVFRHRITGDDSPPPGAGLVQRARAGYREAFEHE